MRMMIKNKKIQIRCNEELYSKITKYRDEKGLGKDAAAARELISFALRVLEHSDNDEGVSTRELLESILSYSIKGHFVSSLVHHQVYREDENKDDLNKAKERYSLYMEKANVRTKEVLSGKDGTT
jgi:hypothetical protein